MDENNLIITFFKKNNIIAERTLPLRPPAARWGPMEVGLDIRSIRVIWFGLFGFLNFGL